VVIMRRRASVVNESVAQSVCDNNSTAACVAIKVKFVCKGQSAATFGLDVHTALDRLSRVDLRR